MAKKTGYSATLTAGKLWKQLIIWGLPQLVALFLNVFSQYTEMTVGGLLSLAATAYLDWLKHKTP